MKSLRILTKFVECGYNKSKNFKKSFGHDARGMRFSFDVGGSFRAYVKERSDKEFTWSMTYRPSPANLVITAAALSGAVCNEPPPP